MTSQPGQGSGAESDGEGGGGEEQQRAQYAKQGRVDLGDRRVDLQQMGIDQLVALVKEYEQNCNYWKAPPEGTVLAHEYDPTRDAPDKEVQELGSLLHTMKVQENVSTEQLKQLATFRDIRPSSDILADCESGQPLRDVDVLSKEDLWRARTISTYNIDQYGRGNLEVLRTRPFYKDYRHYKYYGFAGKGAKTAWGRNRKGAVYEDYNPERALYPEKQNRDTTVDLEMVVNPHRPDERPRLTRMKKKLLKEFSEHSYGGGVPSLPHSPRSSSSEQTSQRRATQAERIAKSILDAGPSSAASTRRPSPRVQGKPTLVELDSGKPIARRRASSSGSLSTAKVRALEDPNLSVEDMLGRQDGGDVRLDSGDGHRAFHQRYRHYKYKGFAGRGAKSSWAQSSP